MRSIITCLTCLFFLQTIHAQFVVTPALQPPYNNTIALAEQFLAGSGIKILNIEYTGSDAAVGFFSDGSPVIGLDRGLLLSTGHVKGSGTMTIGAEGTGADFASTNTTGPSTDLNLQPLVDYPLFDVSRYTITFMPYGDSIRFRYVFASEEYPEYACTSFNDIFGFFLQGPGFPTATNIAVIPGTMTPVAINNIHPANNTQAQCPPLYEQYYNDNNQSNIQPVYDGFLDVFVAEAAVQACGVYTMTLAIADVSDGIFDSGVFLEGNSFGSNPGVASSIIPGDDLIPESAIAAPVTLTFTELTPALLPLTVSIEGSAINGVDYVTIDSLYTISAANATLDLLFQPIADTLVEVLDSILIKVTGANCFTTQFVLYIADPDSMFRPLDTLLYSNTPLSIGFSPTGISDNSWTLSNNNMVPIVTDVLTYSNITVNNLSLATLNSTDFLASVCMSIEHGWADDLEVYLVAPNGRFVELTTDNGGNGDNYTNTCFSPLATESINGNLPFAPNTAAPFTGTFQPEGLWSDILGTPVNGTWQLAVLDDKAGFNGSILNWNITFSGVTLGHFSYAWSTGDTSQYIQVNTPGEYTVTVTNGVSSIEKTYVLSQVSDAPEVRTLATAIQIQPNPAREQIQLSWDGNTRFDQLEVFSLTGERVLMQTISLQNKWANATVSGFKPGMYILRLSGPDGVSSRTFLVGQ
jgi:subtilisin-like proprotein convertase family protein